MEDDHVITAAISGERNTGSLVLGPEPTRNGLNTAPSGHVAVSVQLANPVVSVVLPAGVIEMENHKFWSPIPVDIGDGDVRPLVLGPEPPRHSLDIAPAPRHVAVWVE